MPIKFHFSPQIQLFTWAQRCYHAIATRNAGFVDSRRIPITIEIRCSPIIFKQQGFAKEKFGAKIGSRQAGAERFAFRKGH